MLTEQVSCGLVHGLIQNNLNCVSFEQHVVISKLVYISQL